MLVTTVVQVSKCATIKEYDKAVTVTVTVVVAVAVAVAALQYSRFYMF
jgi:hypothetical protein